MQRSLIIVSSLANPFLEAWRRLLDKLGPAVVLTTSPKGCLTDYPDTSALVWQEENEWRTEVESLLGGPPSVLFYWWGFQSLSNTGPMDTWAVAHVSLCVDTFPNASRLVTEARETLGAVRLVRRVDSFISTSTEMRDMLMRRLGVRESRRHAVVESPFLLVSHSRTRSFRPVHDTPRLCFTGRSDYLFSGSSRMQKDDLGDTFEKILSEGAEIWVQEPSDLGRRSILEDRGFKFYPWAKRSDLCDGKFADYLATFDGNLVMYSVKRATTRRRVANGLSTRFATALCSPCPIIVPPEAKFARRFISKFAVGTTYDEPSQMLEMISTKSLTMKGEWMSHHQKWAGERYLQVLQNIFEQ